MITLDELRQVAELVGAEMSDYSDRTPDRWLIKHSNGVWCPWDPLGDDGDSRRLEVQLRMHVHICDEMQYVSAYADGACQGQAVDFTECEGDVAKVTRLAVFAAALQLAKDKNAE